MMPSDLDQGQIIESSIARVDTEKAAALSGYRIQKDDILFPRRGDLTKRALVLQHQEGWMCGTGTIRVRLNGTVHPRAILYALTSRSTNLWLERFSVGTTMPNLNASTVGKIPLRIPSAEVCEQIVEIAENAEANVHSIRNHILLLGDMMRRLSEEMIVGV